MTSTFVTPRRHSTAITPRGSGTNDPVSVTPRRRMPLTPVNSQPRKQYRISKIIPRQTLHNRKKRRKLVSLDDPEAPVNPELNTITDDLQNQDDDPPDPTNFSGDIAAPDLSLSSENREARQDLFSGSTISVCTSSLLI